MAQTGEATYRREIKAANALMRADNNKDRPFGSIPIFLMAIFMLSPLKMIQGQPSSGPVLLCFRVYSAGSNTPCTGMTNGWKILTGFKKTV
jgi:hypothetical protein